MRLAICSLMMLAPLSLSASAQPSPFKPVPMADITVSLQNFSFSPSPIQLQAGQPVRLQFVNRATKGHDFTAREFFASSRIVEGRENVADGKVEVAGGKSVTIALVPARGSYKAHCGRPFHTTMGMHTDIIVR